MAATMATNRPFVILWIAILAVPFCTSIFLAASISGDHATQRGHIAWRTAVSNFASVVEVNKAGGSSLPRALFTSLWICLSAATITVCLAAPTGQFIGLRYEMRMWTIAAAAVGTRVVPVTAALPVFAAVQAGLRLGNSWQFTLVLYVALFLPFASALLAAAPWQEIMIAQQLLGLDAALSRGDRLRYWRDALGSDVALAAVSIFLLCWSDFVVASFFLPSDMETVTGLLFKFQAFSGTQWGKMGAALAVSLLPIMVVMLLTFTLIKRRRVVTHE